MTLQEQIALIYTSQGSQTKTAKLIGISRQRVGRILLTGRPELGGLMPDSRVFKNPIVIDAVEQAFEIHKKLARDIARKHGLPFNGKIPVYAARALYHVHQRTHFTDGTSKMMPMFYPDGRPAMAPGNRIEANHTHWLSDKQRNTWIGVMHRSNKFHSLSVRSIIDLYIYNQRANARHRKLGPNATYTDSQLAGKLEFKKKRDDGYEAGYVWTQRTFTEPDFDVSEIINDVQKKLNTRHRPAIKQDSRDNRLADSISLQWRTAGVETKAKPKPRAKKKAKRGSKKLPR